MVRIRKAVSSDIDAIKVLVDDNRRELGFVLRPALLESIQRDEVLVATDGKVLMGMVDYHHRQDEQTTIYHIVVADEWRRQGIGSQLLTVLREESRDKGKTHILLKCPVDLPANDFYSKVGFQLVAVENGRSRKLNVWKTTRLIVCLEEQD